MEYIGRLLEVCKQGLQKEMNVYGYTITWWQIYVFIIVASIITMLIVGFLIDD